MKKRKRVRIKRRKKVRNISRVDQEKRNQHGYLVRVMRNKVMHQKFFSDSVCGGRRGAYSEAQIHRDELRRLYPKPKRGNMFGKKTSRNTSGHAGISKTGSYRKGRYYESWQATWILKPGGQRITKKFGFSPNGRSEMAAKRLAIQARREALAAIGY